MKRWMRYATLSTVADWIASRAYAVVPAEPSLETPPAGPTLAQCLVDGPTIIVRWMVLAAVVVLLVYLIVTLRKRR